MADKKFIGKIWEDPWEALAKGPREVMASIWQDYLTEVLGISPKSGRFKVLRREIDGAAGFDLISENWNTLPPESRGAGHLPGRQGDHPEGGAPEGPGSAGQPAVLVLSGGHPELPHL